MKKINVAIDGPAASGKSTIAKQIAKDLGMKYIDTGAMYRAITLYLLENEVDLKNEDYVKKQLNNINVDFNESIIFLNGRNVNKEIRTEEVTMNVSLISSYESVRTLLTNLQKKIAIDKNVIMDGRDIGTVVMPNSEVKVYMVASPEVRAKRRLSDFGKEITQDEIDKMALEISKRDEYDSNREISPLKHADDAIVVDTSKLSQEETYQQIKDLILEKSRSEEY